MSLLSNSLFLDSEYKADCEYKINYLSLMNLNNKTDDTVDLKDDDNLNDVLDKNKNQQTLTPGLLKQLETKVIIAESDEKPYADDGTRLYNTKQIADEYYKILIEQ